MVNFFLQNVPSKGLKNDEILSRMLSENNVKIEL